MVSWMREFARRIVNFPGKTSHQKFESYVYRWLRWFPGIPAPVKLPFGAWWLLERDFLGASLLGSGYEGAECNFERRFVEPGMIVLDIGAHQGFHTLLLSKKVGSRGRVFSFEPSPVNLRRLILHLRINLCRNVEVLGYALGEEDGPASLYIVPSNSVLNSLRPPVTSMQTSAIPVAVRRLDDVLFRAGVADIDFVKIDVEGGELGVLRGAERLLSRIPRPIVLCEVLEERTRPWGYAGSDIVQHLLNRGYAWFEVDAAGSISKVSPDRTEFRGNFVAVPNERLDSIRPLMRSPE